MTVHSRPLQAIGIMLVSMACFSAMNTTIRLLTPYMHSTQMVFLRNICSLLLVLAWQYVRHRRLPVFRTQRLIGHFWRASIGICAMELWFHAITLLPLTLATALSFTTPIFSTIIAILFLGEKAGIRRWSAIVVGFIGMLIILRPGISGVNSDALFVIGSSLMMGIAGVLVKSLTRTEAPETIVFYMALFMIPWSSIPAFFTWQAVSLYALWLVFLVALFSTTAHLLMARAYMRADMVMLMPFDFSRLIFTAIIAYVLFDETMDMPTICGSLVIIASSVYIAHREARSKKSIISPAA